ncbi:InlB B-repeat-containing protein [uncultured Peptoniphilus sp.]|uniref:InlB B-repeat-containing protein n=1 Tax=uncultured Peptoniphilus sp. TaxID=254354 RepID=UPI002615D3FE|nr:InlB B-repeat-containing protein [uncultured Peptoniphilus sp.]
MGNYLKRTTTFILALLMLLSVPLQAFATVNYEKLADDKEKFVNTLTPVKPAKTDNAEEFIKNPDQPAIYTLRTDYKVQRGEKYYIDYQPYIASVGAGATADEQKKVNQTIKLPELAGYEKPEGQESFKIDYDTVKNAANNKNETGDATNGLRYSDRQDFKYTARSNSIKIKHVFQDLEDFTKYTNPDGTVGDETALFTTQSGNTGSTMEVSPLDKNDPRVKGFVPERKSIMMQVPENSEDFILEYRYNRAHYDVVFDTQGGTALPTRTLYYGQEMPKIADADIPTKVGGEFQGWKPSVDLESINGSKYRADEIIKDTNGKAILNLAADIKMPASKVTFTAVWKDKEKAGYAVQFWAEKADHADGASLADKYDYIGTRVYKDQDTGSRPDLDNVSVKDIVFPDLDQFRLAKIWKGDKFNRGKDLYLNKFYVYNQALTHEQNKDPANVNLVKSVDATGKTVYNIYYDRQVYDLYFTKSNAQPKENTFYPEIWGYDEATGEVVKKGGPGNPYHYKARFNQLMLGWPNDAMQTKGFSKGMQSYGWGPNYATPDWPTHLDTPPYRLNADEFLDMGVKTGDYTRRGGYTKHIDNGDGTTIDLDTLDFKTLSFGIKQNVDSMPHHMDFWMDGFKPGETIIRYDLYRFKADTNSDSYGHKFSKVQGFTPYEYTPGGPWPEIKEEDQENGRVDGDGLDALNAERAEVTPFPTKTYTIFGNALPIGKMQYISTFFNNADDWGDPLTDGEGNPIVPAYNTNGYIRFKYKRNKYPLRFNYDPSTIKGDSEFGPTNSLNTFYEFPLKALSPDLEGNEEYKKENPANLLDNPEKLKELGLTDLVFNDQNDNNKLKVKRPDNLSDQMVFKGWALDPAGTKLIWENPGEKMPSHPVNLYAKWGEPDYQWKVTFDPNGGNLSSIDEAKVTQKRKTIQVGDKGQEETKTFAQKEKNEGDKQVFTVIQRQKLVEPKFKPTRKGYDFMGWEVIRYKKDPTSGDYTDQIDTSYRDTYNVPELYSFGNDVVSPIYLKAIWVPNNRVDVKVVHHFLSLDLSKETKEPLEQTLANKRANYLVATTGDQQDDKYILATHEELEEKLPDDLKALYKEYNGRVKADNTFFQTFKVEPAKKLNPATNKVEDNPDVKNNVFHFFYRPFRTRDYKVNYIDERFKGKTNEAEGAIIGQEAVSNGNRHFDARNYRPIPGWKLVSAPQQQLFFDVNEKTNAFLGINGTGKDEITFYYKDVRVIEVPGDKEPPEGYVRVTFKADKGGAFTDKDGNSKTELYYDVIQGLKSDLLPVPKELEEGKEKEEGKYYITPETGKKFIKWDEKPLLNKNTIVDNDTKDFYVFTAKFEWSGLSASGLVKTEAFKDPNGKWTNDFAPKIEDLKKQLVWKEKDQVKDLPAGTEIKLYDEKGTELTTYDQVYDLVNEKNKADKDELVRTVNIKAKVTFKDGKEPQELIIPITVYKNVYEALTGTEKPLFLSQAEGKEAKDGGLKDVTGEYVKVTVAPTGDMNSKDNKVYWVNKNAWVEIPEVKPDGSSTFVNWTADQAGQNDDGQANGKFDFGKRHKFTTATIIQPVGAGDVVEQTDPSKKPDVPGTYVKVIVKTTDKATDDTAFEKTFWVNPTKEVSIDVTNPTGKTVAADPAKVGAVGYTMNFSKWETEDKAKTWEDKILGQFTTETTIVAKYTVTPEKIKDQVPTTYTVHTPQGKTPTVEEITKMITPPEGKTIKEVKIVTEPDVTKPGESKVKVIVEYDDGSSVGTNDKPLEIPVKVHEPIVKSNPDGTKPEEAMDNYVKVIFKAGEGGTVSGDLVYYVSPEVEVNMTSQAEAVTKKPSIGYTSNGGTWSPEIKAEKIIAEKTYEFNFVKSKDIVEKTDDSVKKPEGYVTVKFIAGENGEVVGGNKIYYVNPEANIKLVDKDKAIQGATNELIIPEAKASDNYGFAGWVEKIDYINPIKGDREHVANFTLGKITLTYEAGEGTGTPPAVVTVDHGTSIRLARPDGLTKENATFKGWKLDGEDEKIYQPGDQVTLKKARTATAQWKTDKHKVKFDTDGGSEAPATQEVEHGKTATKPADPTKDKFVFLGWKEKETDTTYFDFENKPIDKDIVLYAQWTDAVQEISENDTIDTEKFIKVTFNEGQHGKLKLADQEQTSPVTYKVAKGLNFEEAQDKGMIVPGISPAKYYKVKQDQAGEKPKFGWDKELNLTLATGETEKIFTAQYEPIADVIPVDPTLTPDNKLQDDKPEGMVLVEFKVPTDKAYMLGYTKFYVTKDKEVEITPPLVVKTDENYDFKGWGVDEETKKVTRKFEQDTEINSDEIGAPDIIIQIPSAGVSFVKITNLTDGATGHLVLTRGGQEYEFTSGKMTKRTKVRRKIVEEEITCFDLSKQGVKLQANDKISVYATTGNLQSDKREYTIR